MRKWINDHPKTIISIAIVAVLILIATIVILRVAKKYKAQEDREDQQVSQKRRVERMRNMFTFNKISLKLKTLDGKVSPLIGRRWSCRDWRDKGRFWGGPWGLHGVTNCGKVMDVMWSDNSILLMREPGLLEEVFFNKDVYFMDLECDGKNIWVGTRHQGIWIFDSSGKVITKIGKENGLPAGEKGLLLCAIDVGKMLAVGSFGPHGRGWCATVEFKDGKTSVDVFHKATRVKAHGDDIKDLETDPFVVFTPSWLHEYRHKDSQTVFIGRCEKKYSGNPKTLKRYPLEIDLNNMSVSVLSDRMAFSELKTRSCVKSRKPSFEYNGKIYQPGKPWYRLDPETNKREALTDRWKLPVPLGSMHDFWVSANYGLAGWIGDKSWGSTDLYQIVVNDDKDEVVEKSPEESNEPKNYFHTFAFEDENGMVTNHGALDITYFSIKVDKNTFLQYHYKDFKQGGYFPPGTYKARRNSGSAYGKKIEGCNFEPIEVTPESPEHLVFKIKTPEDILYRGTVINALSGEPMEGITVNVDTVYEKTGYPKKLKTDSNGHFELTLNTTKRLRDFIAGKKDYLSTKLSCSKLSQSANKTVELPVMPLFPAAKIKVYPCIEIYNNGRPCIEAINVNLYIEIIEPENYSSKTESTFFSLHSSHGSRVHVVMPHVKMNMEQTYDVPAGFKYRIKFEMAYSRKWWCIPEIPQTINLKQGETLDIGRYVFDLPIKIFAKVVNSAGDPIQNVYFYKNPSDGHRERRTGKNGVAILPVKANCNYEFTVGFRGGYRDSHKTFKLQVGGEEDEGKTLTVTVLESGAIKVSDLHETTEVFSIN